MIKIKEGNQIREDMEHKKTGTERAKEIFLKYDGNHFFMDREGEGAEYESYRVPKETEEAWTMECVHELLDAEHCGKEALRLYFSVSQMLKRSGHEEVWERCLYYPLRSKQLDDVSILYMLRGSFEMAERAARKGCFSKEEAKAYLEELDEFAKEVSDRVRKGNLTRAKDYIPQEFSDPVYVDGYLDDLRKKWSSIRWDHGIFFHTEG